jgi:2-oxoglutarate ferredoxin oxidoreductase subunit delta
MPKITIDKNRCKDCLLCVGVCPKGAIIETEELNRLGVKPVQPKEGAECVGCMMCVLMCPDCCIEVYK